ncbi:MAG: chromosome partitioning protein ParB [Myxococcales bacterium]|nr:chromosome partitioning protein ParB [Myxococcales bacterium]
MIDAADCATGVKPAQLEKLAAAVVADGGAVLAEYREPLGGHWQLLCSLPIRNVVPAPFQRDLSDSHVVRMREVIERTDRFLDPLITVRTDSGDYWTPNGYHRLEAMRRIGARAVVAIVVPEVQVAYQILALNTERAPGTREKSMQALRLARLLAKTERLPELEFAPELETPYYVTFGICYEARPRFAASAYQGLLRRVDAFLDEELGAALATREARAGALLELDDKIGEILDVLREDHGLDSSARAAVIAHVNPLRGTRATRDRVPTPREYDEAMRAIFDAAAALDVAAFAEVLLSGPA